MNNKENIYDEQIAPLMKQIIEICKKEEIPMIADFQYSDTNFCTTFIYPDVKGRNMSLEVMHILSKCREGNSINFDQFYFNIAKKYDNKSSIVMKLLGKEPIQEPTP